MRETLGKIRQVRIVFFFPVIGVSREREVFLVKCCLMTDIICLIAALLGI
jgi:hypothetical protein